MDNLINISQELLLVKDMSSSIDFNLLNATIKKLEFEPNVLNTISVDKNIFDIAEFADIKQVLTEECKSYLRNLQIGHKFTDLKITNSWVNITEPGQGHHKHMHQFSVVSGVLYLDDNPDNLKFSIETSVPQIPYFLENDDAFYSLETFIGKESNLKNHLLLFLSNRQHFVQAVDSQRRSIAFNTFWNGRTGDLHIELGRFDFK